MEDLRENSLLCAQTKKGLGSRHILTRGKDAAKIAEAVGRAD
jgi:hypothetical protein